MEEAIESIEQVQGALEVVIKGKMLSLLNKNPGLNSIKLIRLWKK